MRFGFAILEAHRINLLIAQQYEVFAQRQFAYVFLVAITLLK